MSKRNVTLKVTSQKELIKAESGARTFGELKAEMKNVKWSGMRVVERGTKHTLQDDAALLPAGDFVLFLVPEKVKSGAKVKKLKNIGTASYNDLRSHGSQLNKAKDAGIDKAYYDSKNPAKATADAPAEVPAEAETALAAVEAARVNINSAIDTVVGLISEAKTVEVPIEDTTEYILKVSVDDLDAELAEIKKALKL
jgi:hypothetical protein